MKKILSALLVSGVVAMAGAANYVPMRVGPVSSYGALGTSGAQVISQVTKKPVMLRGMSLFWSDAIGSPYYNENVIAWAAENLGMDIFRFAMGIGYYDSDGGVQNAIESNYSYLNASKTKETQLDKMVKAAIENDIYIIIDWHSHRAQVEQAKAKDFFSRMAEKYKDVPNIIWEVYNEPKTDMGTIASYANDVIGAIRDKGSSNLAIVGTPEWSQLGSCSGVDKPNVAYVLHFYAATHSLGSFKGNIENCMGAGKAVFISEWGVTSADGSGSVSTSEAGNWTSYMDQKMISNCNWSLRHATADKKTENSAMFDGSTALLTKDALDKATYTTSGKFVKDYLTKNKRSWEDTLTAGARSGACAFKHVTEDEMKGSVSGVASASCTYQSSNEAVAVVEAGVIQLKKAGVAVMTGNDGTKSIVRVTMTPSQSVNLTNVFCALSGNGNACLDYTGSGTKNEYRLPDKTGEGSTITYTVKDPSIVTIAKANCTTSNCYSDKGKQLWIATFKSLGSTEVTATAPAASGYKPLDTTVVFTYSKPTHSMNTKYFKDQTVALGSKTQVFNLTAQKEPVTFTIVPEGYATQDSIYLIAGDKDATINIIATIAESEEYAAFTDTITVVIGAGMALPKTKANMAIAGFVQGGKLILDVKHSGFVKVQIVDMNGRNVVREQVMYMSAGTNSLKLSGVAQGKYLINVKQSSMTATIPWSNK